MKAQGHGGSDGRIAVKVSGLGIRRDTAPASCLDDIGGEFRADPAVLARETQTVSQSEGEPQRHGVTVGGFDYIGAGSTRLEIVKTAKACCEGRNLRPLNW